MELVVVFAGTTVYKELGDKVVLTPDSVPDVIQVITWREGSDLAMEWERSDPEPVAYRQFKGRSRGGVAQALARRRSRLSTLSVLV